jgi:hypothetical protein
MSNQNENSRTMFDVKNATVEEGVKPWIKK